MVERLNFSPDAEVGGRDYTSRAPLVSPVFFVDFDVEGFVRARPRKLEPKEIFEHYERDGALGFIAYQVPGRPEPTTLVEPLAHQKKFSSSTPEQGWSAVQYIGAGTITGKGPWFFEVTWGHLACEKQFGRSHPRDGAEHAQAEQQVIRDFRTFLALARREGWHADS